MNDFSRIVQQKELLVRIIGKESNYQGRIVLQRILQLWIALIEIQLIQDIGTRAL